MKTIDGKRMKELVEMRKAHIVDIDPESDFRQSHIMGAASIPHSEKDFLQKVQKRFSQKTEDIVLCANKKSETQLNRLTKELEDAGYKNVHQYKAGPSDWKNANLSIQKSA